jgi:hypothetical protein
MGVSAVRSSARPPAWAKLGVCTRTTRHSTVSEPLTPADVQRQAVAGNGVEKDLAFGSRDVTMITMV